MTPETDKLIEELRDHTRAFGEVYDVDILVAQAADALQALSVENGRLKQELSSFAGGIDRPATDLCQPSVREATAGAETARYACTLGEDACVCFFNQDLCANWLPSLAADDLGAPVEGSYSAERAARRPSDVCDPPAQSPAGGADLEPLYPISTDGPHTICDHRRWLARQLMDSKLSDEEAYGIVAHSPALKEHR